MTTQNSARQGFSLNNFENNCLIVQNLQLPLCRDIVIIYGNRYSHAIMTYPTAANRVERGTEFTTRLPSSLPYPGPGPLYSTS